MSIALKFTSLFLRTLAKPIANQIKTQAREHPKFRRRCIVVAQRIHKTEITLRRHLLNEGDKKVRPSNDARAIQMGANFVAESFVFSVAGALILFESWRSRRKELKRQESVADDIKLLQDEIAWIKEKLKESTIIKQGEDPPIPEDLHPMILKLVKEEIHTSKDIPFPSQLSPSENVTNVNIKDSCGDSVETSKIVRKTPESSIDANVHATSQIDSQVDNPK